MGGDRALCAFCVCGLYNALLGLCVQGQADLGLRTGEPEPKVCMKGTYRDRLRPGQVAEKCQTTAWEVRR